MLTGLLLDSNLSPLRLAVCQPHLLLSQPCRNRFRRICSPDTRAFPPANLLVLVANLSHESNPCMTTKRLGDRDKKCKAARATAETPSNVCLNKCRPPLSTFLSTCCCHLFPPASSPASNANAWTFSNQDLHRPNCCRFFASPGNQCDECAAEVQAGSQGLPGSQSATNQTQHAHRRRPVPLVGRLLGWGNPNTLSTSHTTERGLDCGAQVTAPLRQVRNPLNI